jgi:hypothetical protein
MDRDTSRRLYEELKNKDDPDHAELEAWFREHKRWWRRDDPWRTSFNDLAREWLFRRWLGLR